MILILADDLLILILILADDLLKCKSTGRVAIHSLSIISNVCADDISDIGNSGDGKDVGGADSAAPPPSPATSTSSLSQASS